MRVMSTPRLLDVEITSKCNLRCKYCYHFNSAGETKEDIETEEWLRFFEELKQCVVMEVCLGGGEPFLRDDLKEILSSLARNQIRFSIMSNGTLITDEIAAFIAASKRCNYVQVSIDGSIPITHDEMRGKGNFSRAINGLKTLLRHGITATVRVTIHKGNVYDLEGIAELLLEEIGLNSFSTNSASYMGLCRRNAEQIMLTPKERSLAMVSLVKLEKKYNGRISAQAGPLADGKIWLEMERARKEGLLRLPGRGYLSACGAVFGKLAVRADGVMIPCIQLSNIELGKINKDSLVKVWQEHPELLKIRGRRSVHLSSFEFCEGCDYIPYCTGNCPALASNILGKVNHPSPDACLRRFLQEGGVLPENI
ncbi:radical SAM domain protein [delta proteobacterium NaphS2]|nr:radical SAM domain protein [delta proteobacterium NaphS2]